MGQPVNYRAVLGTFNPLARLTCPVMARSKTGTAGGEKKLNGNTEIQRYRGSSIDSLLEIETQRASVHISFKASTFRTSAAHPPPAVRPLVTTSFRIVFSARDVQQAAVTVSWLTSARDVQQTVVSPLQLLLHDVQQSQGLRSTTRRRLVSFAQRINASSFCRALPLISSARRSHSFYEIQQEQAAAASLRRSSLRSASPRRSSLRFASPIFKSLRSYV
ncbi:aconitate hydratase AcnA [Sesbania bispinosa]|nr:aconitate hydratase AcnA [Sesbania bispinosa]